ncbi:unnamed protein product, partial [Closterium sp. NIES-65]
AHYEASCAALLHLLAFSAPPALASVRQAAVRVCARMATVGGGGGGRVSRAPCCSASPPMLMPPVRPVSGEMHVLCSLAALLCVLSLAATAVLCFKHPAPPAQPLEALSLCDHVVLDACTALAASLLALPPHPLSRPLRHAPIPALPLPSSHPLPVLPSPPSSTSPLVPPLATLTAPLLAALWRLHLSRSAPALRSHGTQASTGSTGCMGSKGSKGRDGGGKSRGGVVARAAEWLWGATGAGDARVVGGEAVMGAGEREGGMGGERCMLTPVLLRVPLV